jgi:opacity protein-like surface antigen
MQPSQGGSVFTDRTLRFVTVVAALVLSAATASAQTLASPAQPTFERGWIDVNFGIAMAAEDAFSMRASGEIFSETAEARVDYRLPRGAAFDFGGGVMITPVIGVGMSFSGTAHEDSATISARIPHPALFNTYATDESETDLLLQRVEGAVHLQAMVVAAQTPRFRLRMFGGPSYFRVEQDAVTDFHFDQVALVIPRVNEIEIDSFTHDRIETTGWGFHAGADASVFFTRVVGVGGFARFSRGSVSLENTLASILGADDVVSVKAGGFQVGGGLRLKF